jgi:hypothetical protein
VDGDEQEDIGAPDPVEDQGSVGDWRLPDWMPRISGVAWLFIALAILGVANQVLTWMPTYGYVLYLEPGFLASAVARSAPILIPAGVLWQRARARPRLRGPLVLGSLAIAVGAILASAFALFTASFDTAFGSPALGGSGAQYDPSPEFAIPLVVALVVAIAGPVLLGTAIRRPRTGAPSRWTTWAGLVIAGLTVAYLAFTVSYSVAFFDRFADPYSGGLEFFWGRVTYGIVGVLSLFGWAYFGWAVISAAGSGARPRGAWRMAVLAVVIQQGTIAVTLVAALLAFVASPSGESTPISDVAVAIYQAVLAATPALGIGATILLVAAFGAGLGRDSKQDDAEDTRPDDGRRGLQPAPKAGA